MVSEDEYRTRNSEEMANQENERTMAISSFNTINPLGLLGLASLAGSILSALGLPNIFSGIQSSNQMFSAGLSTGLLETGLIEPLGQSIAYLVSQASPLTLMGVGLTVFAGASKLALDFSIKQWGMESAAYKIAKFVYDTITYIPGRVGQIINSFTQTIRSRSGSVAARLALAAMQFSMMGMLLLPPSPVVVQPQQIQTYEVAADQLIGSNGRILSFDDRLVTLLSPTEISPAWNQQLGWHVPTGLPEGMFIYPHGTQVVRLEPSVGTLEVATGNTVTIDPTTLGNFVLERGVGRSDFDELISLFDTNPRAVRLKEEDPEAYGQLLVDAYQLISAANESTNTISARSLVIDSGWLNSRLATLDAPIVEPAYTQSVGIAGSNARGVIVSVDDLRNASSASTPITPGEFLQSGRSAAVAANTNFFTLGSEPIGLFGTDGVVTNYPGDGRPLALSSIVLQQGESIPRLAHRVSATSDTYEYADTGESLNVDQLDFAITGLRLMANGVMLPLPSIGESHSTMMVFNIAGFNANTGQFYLLSLQTTFTELASVLPELGLTDAIYLDSGLSATVLVKAGNGVINAVQEQQLTRTYGRMSPTVIGFGQARVTPVSTESLTQLSVLGEIDQLDPAVGATPFVATFARNRYERIQSIEVIHDASDQATTMFDLPFDHNQSISFGDLTQVLDHQLRQQHVSDGSGRMIISFLDESGTLVRNIVPYVFGTQESGEALVDADTLTSITTESSSSILSSLWQQLSELVRGLRRLGSPGNQALPMFDALQVSLEDFGESLASATLDAEVAVIPDISFAGGTLAFRRENGAPAYTTQELRWIHEGLRLVEPLVPQPPAGEVWHVVKQPVSHTFNYVGGSDLQENWGYFSTRARTLADGSIVEEAVVEFNFEELSAKAKFGGRTGTPEVSVQAMAAAHELIHALVQNRYVVNAVGERVRGPHPAFVAYQAALQEGGITPATPYGKAEGADEAFADDLVLYLVAKANGLRPSSLGVSTEAITIFDREFDLLTPLERLSQDASVAYVLSANDTHIPIYSWGQVIIINPQRQVVFNRRVSAEFSAPPEFLQPGYVVLSLDPEHLSSSYELGKQVSKTAIPSILMTRAGNAMRIPSGAQPYFRDQAALAAFLRNQQSSNEPTLQQFGGFSPLLFGAGLALGGVSGMGSNPLQLASPILSSLFDTVSAVVLPLLTSMPTTLSLALGALGTVILSTVLANGTGRLFGEESVVHQVFIANQNRLQSLIHRISANKLTFFSLNIFLISRVMAIMPTDVKEFYLDDLKLAYAFFDYGILQRALLRIDVEPKEFTLNKEFELLQPTLVQKIINTFNSNFATGNDNELPSDIRLPEYRLSRENVGKIIGTSVPDDAVFSLDLNINPLNKNISLNYHLPLDSLRRSSYFSEQSLLLRTLFENGFIDEEIRRKVLDDCCANNDSWLVTTVPTLVDGLTLKMNKYSFWLEYSPQIIEENEYKSALALLLGLFVYSSNTLIIDEIQDYLENNIQANIGQFHAEKEIRISGATAEEIKQLSYLGEGENAVPRPIYTNTLSQEKIANFVRRHSSKNSQQLVKFLLENITHISQYDFEGSLKELAIQLNKKLNRKYVVVVEPGKSNSWVYKLVKESLSTQPVALVLSTEIENWLTENPDIDQVVLFDDAIYSAEQMSGHLANIYGVDREAAINRRKLEKKQDARINDDRSNIHTIVLAPYATNRGLKRLAVFENNEVVYSNIIPSVSEIIHDSLTTKKGVQKIIGWLNNQLLKIKLWLFLARGSLDNSYLTYFDHKLPDMFSFVFGDGIAIVSDSLGRKNGGEIKLFDETVPPYKANYLQWAIAQKIMGRKPKAYLELFFGNRNNFLKEFNQKVVGVDNLDREIIPRVVEQILLERVPEDLWEEVRLEMLTSLEESNLIPHIVNTRQPNIFRELMEKHPDLQENYEQLPTEEAVATEELFNFGYSTYSPVLVGYTVDILREMDQQLQRGVPTTTVFAGRDGLVEYEIALALLDRFGSEFPNINPERLKYVELSRNLVYRSPEEALQNYVNVFTNIPVGDELILVDVGVYGSLLPLLQTKLANQITSTHFLISRTDQAKGWLNNNSANPLWGEMPMASSQPKTRLLEDTFSGMRGSASDLILVGGHNIPQVNGVYRGTDAVKRQTALLSVIAFVENLNMSDFRQIINNGPEYAEQLAQWLDSHPDEEVERISVSRDLLIVEDPIIEGMSDLARDTTQITISEIGNRIPNNFPQLVVFYDGVTMMPLYSQTVLSNRSLSRVLKQIEAIGLDEVIVHFPRSERSASYLRFSEGYPNDGAPDLVPLGGFRVGLQKIIDRLRSRKDSFETFEIEIDDATRAKLEEEIRNVASTLPERGQIRYLGTDKPWEYSQSELEETQDPLFHGNTQPSFSVRRDFTSADAAVLGTDGSETLGFGLYTSWNEQAAASYGKVRQMFGGTPSVHKLYLSTASLLNLVDEAKNNGSNIPLSVEFISAWRNYLILNHERILAIQTERGMREQYQFRLDELIVLLNDAVANNSPLDLRTALDTETNGNSLWSKHFPIFMKDMGFDGLIYYEGVEGEYEGNDRTVVIYNFDVIGTYEDWLQRANESEAISVSASGGVYFGSGINPFLGFANLMQDKNWHQSGIGKSLYKALLFFLSQSDYPTLHDGFEGERIVTIQTLWRSLLDRLPFASRAPPVNNQNNNIPQVRINGIAHKQEIGAQGLMFLTEGEEGVLTRASSNNGLVAGGVSLRHNGKVWIWDVYQDKDSLSLPKWINGREYGKYSKGLPLALHDGDMIRIESSYYKIEIDSSNTTLTLNSMQPDIASDFAAETLPQVSHSLVVSERYLEAIDGFGVGINLYKTSYFVGEKKSEQNFAHLQMKDGRVAIASSSHAEDYREIYDGMEFTWVIPINDQEFSVEARLRQSGEWIWFEVVNGGELIRTLSTSSQEQFLADVVVKNKSDVEAISQVIQSQPLASFVARAEEIVSRVGDISNLRQLVQVLREELDLKDRAAVRQALTTIALVTVNDMLYRFNYGANTPLARQRLITMVALVLFYDSLAQGLVDQDLMTQYQQYLDSYISANFPPELHYLRNVINVPRYTFILEAPELVHNYSNYSAFYQPLYRSEIYRLLIFQWLSPSSRQSTIAHETAHHMQDAYRRNKRISRERSTQYWEFGAIYLQDRLDKDVFRGESTLGYSQYFDWEKAFRKLEFLVGEEAVMRFALTGDKSFVDQAFKAAGSPETFDSFAKANKVPTDLALAEMTKENPIIQVFKAAVEHIVKNLSKLNLKPYIVVSIIAQVAVGVLFETLGITLNLQSVLLVEFEAVLLTYFLKLTGFLAKSIYSSFIAFRANKLSFNDGIVKTALNQKDTPVLVKYLIEMAKRYQNKIEAELNISEEAAEDQLPDETLQSLGGFAPALMGLGSGLGSIATLVQTALPSVHAVATIFSPQMLSIWKISLEFILQPNLISSREWVRESLDKVYDQFDFVRGQSSNTQNNTELVKSIFNSLGIENERRIIEVNGRYYKMINPSTGDFREVVALPRKIETNGPLPL